MSPEPDENVVCVLDTSIIIEIKLQVSLDDQWDLLDRMMELVKNGLLVFPRQVPTELTRKLKFPDAPGVWAARAKREIRCRQPSDEHVAKVMSVAQLVEPDSDVSYEVADPYVVAMALALREESEQPFHETVVATTDVVDRMPAKESIATACARLEMPTWGLDELVSWVAGRNTE